MAENVREALRKASLQVQNFIYESSDALVTFVDEVIEVVEDVVDEASDYVTEKVAGLDLDGLFTNFDPATKEWIEGLGFDFDTDEPQASEPDEAVAEPGGSEEDDNSFYRNMYSRLVDAYRGFDYYQTECDGFVESKGDVDEYYYLYLYAPELKDEVLARKGASTGSDPYFNL